MTTQLLKNGCCKNLASIRQLSSYNSRIKSGIASIIATEDSSISFLDWSSFAKQFNKSAQFPFPGQIGIPVKSKPNVNSPKSDLLNELLYKPLPTESQSQTLRQVAFYTKQMESEEYSQETQIDANLFELRAHKVPETLIRDFQMYFPKMDMKQMTLVTVSFKTENDMATWNNDVDSERELLVKKFVDSAQQLCAQFQNQGFWADYVDPECGRPFKSEFGHATFYEADERYRHLGFELLDQGCCKIISHHKWGTKSYVGCLFTMASPTKVDQMLRKFNMST